ncbi:MAG: Hpt domain-containing protein [Alteromonadaceae bacterium]|nr:MAG: Hpt domain-containing protein [Alteromonadaceae bacterium]
MSKLHAIDSETLDSLKDLLGENFNLLIETYIGDSSERMGRLKEAIKADDDDGVCAEAHGIKGSSRNIGAVVIGDLCEVLETQARQQALVDKEEQFAALEQAFADVCEALSAYL